MEFLRPALLWFRAKSSLLLGQDAALGVNQSRGATRTAGEIKKAEAENESQNVVRQKETRAARRRPLRHHFPECSLIAGG